MFSTLKKTEVAIAVTQATNKGLFESVETAPAELASALSIFKKLEVNARVFQGLDVSLFAAKHSVGLFGTYLH